MHRFVWENRFTELSDSQSYPDFPYMNIYHCAQLLSRVPRFVTPWTVAHQAPLSMQFSRQEYWEWVAIPSSRGFSRPRNRTHVSCVSCFGRWVLYQMQLPLLLQEIFPTQGSNPGLPHCRQTLYRLSHQGSLPISCHNKFHLISYSSQTLRMCPHFDSVSHALHIIFIILLENSVGSPFKMYDNHNESLSFCDKYWRICRRNDKQSEICFKII